MTIVSQLLRTKGNDVWSVGPDTTVYDALTLMSQMNIGAVVVLAEGDVAGIFSERDYARRVALQGKSSRTTAVSAVMTDDVYCATPKDTVETCMAIMSDKRFRHLPVLSEADELIGIISIGDVVKALLAEQEVMINHLENYIKS